MDDRSRSFLQFTETLIDPVGHGTHIAGIIAGQGLAGGVKGLAPGARIVVCRALQAEGAGVGTAVADAIVYCADIGVDIINLSLAKPGLGVNPPWVWPAQLSPTEAAIRYAEERGVLCVCAAGNSGPRKGTIESPARIPEALAVGNVDFDRVVADDSSRGPTYRSPSVVGGSVASLEDILDPSEDPGCKPDVVAPGGDPYAQYDIRGMLDLSKGGIVSCRSSEGAYGPVDALDSGRYYTRCGGTSQAAAVVSGLAALALHAARSRGLDLGKNPGRALAHLLRNSAERKRDTQADSAYGEGLVTWSEISRKINWCTENPAVRERVLSGQPQLRLDA